MHNAVVGTVKVHSFRNVPKVPTTIAENKMRERGEK
jgi:hypothetical protein